MALDSRRQPLSNASRRKGKDQGEAAAKKKATGPRCPSSCARSGGRDSLSRTMFLDRLGSPTADTLLAVRQSYAAVLRPHRAPCLCPRVARYAGHVARFPNLLWAERPGFHRHPPSRRLFNPSRPSPPSPTPYPPLLSAPYSKLRDVPSRALLLVVLTASCSFSS